MINSINKGFTLLEVLLVMALLSILFIIIIRGLNPNNIISEINGNKIESDALTIYQALEQYSLKNSTYPDSIRNMSNNSSAHICKTSATTCNSPKINLSSILVPTYFSKIPEYSTDANNSGFYIVKDSNGKIGIGGVRQVDNTTFVKGLNSQSFATNPFFIKCNIPTINGLLAWGVPANDVTISIPYEGASGQTYSQQTLISTGVTGINATLTGGTLNNGSGNLVFNITGTPSGVGIANFSSTIIGNTCSFAANSTVPPIVTNGLVLYLDAGNPASYPGTGTTWTDLSGNNNNGTLVNGVGYNSTNGGSLVFDGFDDYVVTPQISNTGNGTSSQSYCMWIRPNDDNGNILSMSQSNPQMGWNMPPIAVSGSRFRGKFWSNQYLNATSTYVNLQWYYVCLIFSYNSVTTNSYQRLYVNGDLNSEQTNITYSASGLNNFLFFGQQNPGADNTGMFTGLYGIIQIYTNKALTDAEIQQNFNALKGRFGL